MTEKRRGGWWTGRSGGHTMTAGIGSIRVNGILSTHAKTALTRDLSTTKTSAPHSPHSPHLPLKRWGEVDDFSKLDIFLASEAPSYIHGDLIRVDGGEILCRYSAYQRWPGGYAPNIRHPASSYARSTRDSIVSWPSVFLFAS